MLSKLASVSQEYIFGVQEQAGINDVSADTKITDVSSLLAVVFNIAFGVGIAITLFNAGWAAMIFIMSQGDPKEFSRGTRAAIWAVAGMAIVIGSWAFKNIVLSALGITGGDLVEAPSGF